jgi:hypothetical protein
MSLWTKRRVAGARDCQVRDEFPLLVGRAQEGERQGPGPAVSSCHATDTARRTRGRHGGQRPQRVEGYLTPCLSRQTLERIEHQPSHTAGRAVTGLVGKYLRLP